MKHFEFTEEEAKIPFFEKKINPIAYVLFFVGAIVFFAGLSQDPKRVWGIFHTNLLFFLGLAQGGAVFYGLVKTTRGYWSIPILRVIPFSILLLPVISVLLIIEWVVAGHTVFPYFEPHEIEHHRFGWLSPKFVFARDFIVLLIMNLISIRLVSLSLSLDDIKIPFLPTSKKPKEKIESEINLWSKLILAFFIVGYTIIGWDQAMYLDPHWLSTIFGVRFFITMHLTYLATLAILNSSLMLKPEFKEKVGEKYLTNVGTLLFGFCIFWSYLFYAELVVIYMGNIPEFTHWYVERIYSPWSTTFWLEVFFVFTIPFLTLLHIPIKSNPKILPIIALIVLAGLFIRTYDVAYLEIVKSEKPIFGWIEIGITAGFISLAYILSKIYLYQVPRYPVYEAKKF
jgi:hypothetical protein